MQQKSAERKSIAGQRRNRMVTRGWAAGERPTFHRGGSFPPRGRFEKRFSDVERPWLALPSKASTGFLLGLHVSPGFRPYTIYTGLLFLCVIRLENDRDTASISEVIHLDPATRSFPRGTR